VAGSVCVGLTRCARSQKLAPLSVATAFSHWQLGIIDSVGLSSAGNPQDAPSRPEQKHLERAFAILTELSDPDATLVASYVLIAQAAAQMHVQEPDTAAMSRQLKQAVELQVRAGSDGAGMAHALTARARVCAPMCVGVALWRQVPPGDARRPGGQRCLTSGCRTGTRVC
jgi:hypothetical protein